MSDKKKTKASGSPTTVRVAGKRPKDFYTIDRKRLAVEMAKAEGDDPTSRRSAYVRVVRGELLAEAIERAHQTLVVLDEHFHELSVTNLAELGQAASLWSEIGERCAEHERQMALSEVESLALSQTLAQKLVVNGMFDSSGHFYLGGVAHIDGLPFCADIWSVILSHLKHDDRVRFSCASRAFCKLSRSCITKLTIGKRAYGTYSGLGDNRKALADSGRDVLLDEVLAMPNCREVVIESCGHRDSPLRWWIAENIIANSFSKHMSGAGNVHLVFRGHNGANCDTLSNVLAALGMAHLRASTMTNLRHVTVDSIAALTVYTSKMMFMQSRYADNFNDIISLGLDLGGRSDMVDVSCDEHFHIDRTPDENDPDEIVRALEDCSEYKALSPPIFVKTAADWDRAVFLSYSGLDVERLILSTTVYVDPSDTRDVSRCGEPYVFKLKRADSH